jgi:hypothetical protein
LTRPFPGNEIAQDADFDRVPGVKYVARQKG